MNAQCFSYQHVENHSTGSRRTRIFSSSGVFMPPQPSERNAWKRFALVINLSTDRLSASLSVYLVACYLVQAKQQSICICVQQLSTARLTSRPLSTVSWAITSRKPSCSTACVFPGGFLRSSLILPKGASKFSINVRVAAD